MGSDRDSKLKGKETNPVTDPPAPWETQQTQDGVPMAVANDMDTIHGESFLPTAAPNDPYENGLEEGSAGPDVRPHGPDTVVDLDDPKLMPMHADDTPKEAAEAEERKEERYHATPLDSEER